jgi:hypothetical protein
VASKTRDGQNIISAAEVNNVVKVLLTPMLFAVAFSSVFTDGSSAQTVRQPAKPYQRHEMNRPIDKGMAKPAPDIGDRKISRKAPQHIDDGIFKPRSISKTYRRFANPNIR